MLAKTLSGTLNRKPQKLHPLQTYQKHNVQRPQEDNSAKSTYHHPSKNSADYPVSPSENSVNRSIKTVHLIYLHYETDRQALLIKLNAQRQYIHFQFYT